MTIHGANTMSETTEHPTTSRVEGLRERMNGYEHAGHRLARPVDWSVADMDCSLAERRAHSLHMACDRMPIAIGPDELIVGLRTLLAPAGEKRIGCTRHSFLSTPAARTVRRGPGRHGYRMS